MTTSSPATTSHATQPEKTSLPATTQANLSAKSSTTSFETLSSSGPLEVHFLDVGQGDAIFIKLPNNQTMLIDAGGASRGAGVVNYIKSKNTQKLDYVVATHPHEDHIGGMTKVIHSMAIGKFIMPRKGHTTKTYEGMLDALIARNLKVTQAKAGVSVLDTKDLDIDILGPGNISGSNLNNYSAIIKITYKNTSFLFVGDAERPALANIPRMNIDVLKAGHHGSETSSPKSFITRVDPEHAVISVGKNGYGHPHQSTLSNIHSGGAKVYRTDRAGTIVIKSDGKTISVDTSPSAMVASSPAKQSTPIKSTTVAPSVPKNTKPQTTTTKPKTTKPATVNPSANNERIVYDTRTGKKYHENGCRSLARSKIPITLKKAIAKGLTPCKNCH